MANNIQNFGRFRYIEPNDVLENNLYSKSSKDESMNITQAYEDYCIDVELEVRIPNRGVWVSNITQDKSVAVTSNEGRTISFFGGQSDYLTNTPGSLIYKDLLSEKQDRESLGITNIHVTYNSYYVPEVTIKFTDIRGMGLMMPHEEVYRQEEAVKTGTTLNYAPQIEKFFAALFTFPYPEFLLRIKGFYGKKVEYALVVSDFRSNFNNQTGNFEATVKFVGKMYGVYTDIPMAYLVIAPYCRYGLKDDKTIWEQNAFTFANGTPIPTLIDLKDKIVKSTQKVVDLVQNNISDELQKEISKKNLLTTVINAYKAFIKYIGDNHPYNSNTSSVIAGDNLFLFPHEETADGQRLRYSYLYQDDNEKVTTLTRDLHNSITSFNNEYANSLPYVLPLKTKDAYIGVGNHLVTFKKDGSGNLGEPVWEDETIKFTLSDYPNIKTRIEASIKNESEKKFFVVNATSFYESYTRIEEATQQAIDKHQESVDSTANQLIEDALGFKPSIKNTFLILMAHLQTFVQIFSRCVKDINQDSGRSIKNKNLSLQNLPDIPSGINEESHLPPFPAFKSKVDNTFCYPTEVGMRGTIHETDLIDNLFIGCTDIIKSLRETERQEEAQEIITKFFIPTCITDYNCYLDNVSSNIINPYAYTFLKQQDNVGVDWIWFYFGMRCIQKFIMERGSDLTPEEFGTYEAYNLWLAHPQLSTDASKHQDYLNALTTGDYSTSDKFISFLKMNKETKKCYQLVTGFGLVTENSGNLQLIRYTNIYMPARIGHGADYSQFVADAKNTNPNMGFKQCHELHKIIKDKDGFGTVQRTTKYGHRPYGLMNEIPINNLRLWDENIKTYDNIPNNITKHTTLISKQFERNSEFYYNYKEDIGAGENANTNPAWNVVCQKGTDGNFFQYVDDPMPEKYTTLCTIDDHLNPTIENTHLHNMHTIAQRPLFLVNPKNLNAKDFLCSIPHNLERIMKDLREGRKIVHIPYFTKLFIGYIISNIQTIKSEDAMKEFFHDIAVRCGAYKGGEGFYSPNYRVDNDCDGAEGKFVQLLLVLANYFTTTDENLMLTPSTWTSSFTEELSFYADDYNGLPRHIAGDIWALKEKGSFKKDVFGFVDEFTNWSVSTSEGGLKWFANSMCLEMNSSVSVDGKKIFTLDSEDTQLNNMKKFLEIETVYSSLQELSSKNTNKPKVAASNTKNYVNLLFKATDNKSFDKIYRAIYCQGDSDDIENVYLRFNDTYEGVIKLEELLKKIVYFINPYPLTTTASDVDYDETLSTPKENFTKAFTSFISAMKTLYSTTTAEGETAETNANNVSEISAESKFSMYRTLKNLYDKHFHNITEEENKYSIKSNIQDTEMSRFHFIDTLYNDISDSLLINPETVLSLIDVITSGYDSGKGEGMLKSEMSLYSFLSLICERHHMLFIPMPVFNGIIGETDNFEKMFVPIPYSKAHSSNVLRGPSYICFYPHQASQHLDIPISQYADDGFYITNGDMNNTGNYDDLSTISDMYNYEYVIPAFGVEYGSQKQSIFKNISVNMDNPQTTEVAVATTFGIANNRNTDVKSLSFEGQDLYKIYSNYSYTCQVEMMGCAQIQPLMYFQLNNIPMFRGAYQIIQVEHDITPGNMTTSFKGVRVNKTIMPMVSNFISISMKDIEDKSQQEGGTTPSTPPSNFNYTPLDKTKVQSQSMTNHTLSEVTADTLLNDTVLKKHVMFPDNTSEYKNLHQSVKIAFNRLCPTVRQFVYCLAKDLAEMSKELGYTIGIYINSAAREGANKGSYHKTKIDSSDSKYVLRSAVKGTKVSDDGTGAVKEIPYSEMACAIDIQGLVMNTSPSKDGLYRGSIISGNSKGASLQIFHHIVDNYYMYIKELIWEIHGSTKSTDAKIDILHFASIGECSATNEGYVLMSSVTYANGKSKTTKIKGTRNTFCSSFNEACDKIKAKKTHLKTTSYT